MRGLCLWRIPSWGWGRYGWREDLGGQARALTHQGQRSVDNGSKERERTELCGVSHGGAGISHEQMEVPCMWQKGARDPVPPPPGSPPGMCHKLGSHSPREGGRAVVSWGESAVPLLRRWRELSERLRCSFLCAEQPLQWAQWEV